jgi:hypothetical protein
MIKLVLEEYDLTTSVIMRKAKITVLRLPSIVHYIIPKIEEHTHAFGGFNLEDS